ncbi:AI-2E family transporter [Clostridium magnum]|uniref:Pheromone autoinducer 2 transporter n=1 Tax=Clostridium magnum DSM 2767 TaxID=1121326 RepID=A0A161Y6Q0_9CLOT|nr:AI-2E family transporter [Clostridium magnum]KZL94009.1 pheromone autoinducer 2 transporter [Clostridium magnum DSM 2767]SHI00311.1 Predicted PurR-regulated permease PerM [Clostridium magnum DSM 2767]
MEINKQILKNAAEYILLGLIIYLMRDLFNLVLFTFLFSYIIYNLQKFIVNKTHIHKAIITIFLYFIIIGLIGFFIYKYIPEIIKETQIIFKEISKITLPDRWAIYVNSLTEQIDIAKSYDKFMNTILSIGKNVVQGSLNVFISLMLSMFFVLDKEKIVRFVHKFKTSKISCVYNHFEYFGTNFLNSFGKVIQAQFLIALVNSLLSVIFLWIMNFPQLMGLGFMIFILSFIPVAGTVVSLIPLSLIAFNIGGLIKVVSVIIMIALIHCLESYILNPKLMSDKTSLPIFFIFIILIVGKHFMGVWGLLLGIPLFIFILDILNVKISDISKKSI